MVEFCAEELLLAEAPFTAAVAGDAIAAILRLRVAMREGDGTKETTARRDVRAQAAREMKIEIVARFYEYTVPSSPVEE